MEPGTRRCHAFGQPTMSVRDASAASAVGHSAVAARSLKTVIFSMNSDGTTSTCKPKKSLICVIKMSVAIPEVKPIVTG